jgi:hypothetical protein
MLWVRHSGRAATAARAEIHHRRQQSWIPLAGFAAPGMTAHCLPSGISRDFPDDAQIGVNIRAFPALQQD